MKILMIDKNFFFDRRVGLMACSLRDRGHDVRIIMVQPPKGWVDISESQRRLKRRLPPDADIERILFPIDSEDLILGPEGIDRVPVHVRKAKNPFFTDARMLHANRQKLRELLAQNKKGEMLNFAISNPYSTFSWIRRSEILPLWLRLLGGTIISIPAALSFMMSKLFGGKQDEYDQIRSPHIEFDDWDKHVVQYAEKVWSPDVVVANDSLTLPAAFKIKQSLSIPAIFDAHELYSYQPGMSITKAKTYFRREKKLLKNMDHLIVVNSTHAKVVERDFGVKASASCSNATLLPDNFKIGKRLNWIREELGIGDDQKIMLFQGGINKLRKIHYLIEALAGLKYKNVHLVFLTFGSEIDEFKKMSSYYGVRSRVHFLPFVPWDEVVYWAASADVGILPYQARDQNTTLSSPNKMYEFIMAGTPMIVSADLYQATKVIRENNFGIAHSLRDVPDYVRAMELMLDPDRGGPERFRRSFVEHGSKFQWRYESEDAMSIYDRLAESIDGKSDEIININQKSGRDQDGR